MDHNWDRTDPVLSAMAQIRLILSRYDTFTGYRPLGVAI